MLHFLVTLQAFINDRMERDEKGATLVEYGLIIGLVIAIAIGAMTILDTQIDKFFTAVGTKINGITL